MPLPPKNSSEAGLLLRSVTTAEFILDLVDQIDEEVDLLGRLHWYGDLPDTQNIREILAEDIQTHRTALGRWNGDLVSAPMPDIDAVHLRLPASLAPQKHPSKPKE